PRGDSGDLEGQYMSRKRRIFDIDVPASLPEEAQQADAVRRGPMATAIGDTAAALEERRRVEGDIRAENDDLAHEFMALKRAGQILDRVPLDKIRTDKLVRDRSTKDLDLDELKRSLRDIGLSNPIQVEAGAGGYELVQGYRRLSAYRALLEETGDAERWGRIPAVVLAEGEALEALYRRMVDENMVRTDISFAEMAGLARAYAADPDTVAESVEEAVSSLFASAGRQKRSYIRHFAALLDRIGAALAHPEAIPRAVGLAANKRLDSDPKLSVLLAREIEMKGQGTAEGEMAVLRDFALGHWPVSPRGQSPTQKRRARTTFRIPRPEGEVKCTAAVGKVELHLDRDFSLEGRSKLERAVARFLDVLDEED
ncbi:MAG: ParB N-terminal domain-containing protein, partial [Pseudomonadota bacterium]